MKKNAFTVITLITSAFTFAQVGVNTPDPKVTLDITAKNSKGATTAPEGILVPRVDRQRAQSMTGTPVSTLIYVDDASTGSQTGTATNIDSAGYYYFEGMFWVKLNPEIVSRPDVNMYNTNGTLTSDRVITQEDKRLAFTGSVNNAFSVDGSTFSVDAENNRIGIGTIEPNHTLDLGDIAGKDINDEAGKKLAVYNNTAGTRFYGLGVSSNRLQFHAAAAKNSAPAMILSDLGNIGIGIAGDAPAAKVDIVGGKLGLRNALNSGSWDNIWFDVTNSYGPSINASGAETGLQFKVGQNAVGIYGDAGQTLNTVATMAPNGNMGIGTVAPNANAILELNATNKGFLPPRLTTVQRNAIPAASKPAGLMVYNTTTNCMDFWNSSEWVSTCAATPPSAGSITGITCTSASNSGALNPGIAASGVSSVIPYTGGNGGSHGGQTVASTGVTGLTATLAAGSFVNGNGNLTYTISGTPSASGNANFAINIGGRTCTLTRTVTIPAGTIASLNCAGATNNGTLTRGTTASGVSSVISYTAGNGGTHSGQTIASTGVTGLTATLTAGNFATGNGTLTYTITGTPGTAGTASFAINIGGQTCTLTRTVTAPAGTITSLNCAGATNSGTLVHGSAASGVTSVISYTGGNGGSHNGQSVASTGVTGLTATLAAGNFANGNSTLTYTITGTPSGIGYASFAINIGGRTCTLILHVNAGTASVSCAGRTIGSPTTGRFLFGADRDNKYYECYRYSTGQLVIFSYDCPSGSGWNNSLGTPGKCQIGYTP
ncbi:beta strand repeat-containing protein [Chryseobacterium indologenes]|uniref:beta strand repeat-containing protein n=1 Tax=Chryseobacterium indologenes TaxID=253 RepID=UPI004059726D